MSSSMRLLSDPIFWHGLVVIPRLQVSGIGKTIKLKIHLCVLIIVNM